MDKGTLFQLREVLHRTAVREDPGKDPKAAEDFFQLVWESHLVSAALAIVGERNEQSLTISNVAKVIAERFAPLWQSAVR